MRGTIVLTRAYGDRPFKGMVWGTFRDAVIICHPQKWEHAKRGQSHPVAFPKSDVFQYQEGLYDQLVAAIDSGGDVTELWRSATPYE